MENNTDSTLHIDYSVDTKKIVSPIARFFYISATLITSLSIFFSSALIIEEFSWANASILLGCLVFFVLSVRKTVKSVTPRKYIKDMEYFSDHIHIDSVEILFSAILEEKDLKNMAFQAEIVPKKDVNVNGRDIVESILVKSDIGDHYAYVTTRIAQHPIDL